MSDAPKRITAEEIVEAVTEVWQTCENDEELLAHVMALGLTQEQAEDALLMVQSGYSRAIVTDLGVRASSNYDNDPVFKAALKKARKVIANAPKPQPKTFAELEADLKSDDLERKRRAAWELGQIEHSSAAPLLLSVLEDEDLYIRIYTIQSLSNLKSIEAVPALCKFLKEDSDPLILSNSISALGSIGDRSAIPALIEATRHPNDFVRHDAASTLGEIGDERAIPALEALLSDYTIPEERNEDGLLTHTSIHSVRDQARMALKKIRSRIHSTSQAEQPISSPMVKVSKKKWWQLWR